MKINGVLGWLSPILFLSFFACTPIAPQEATPIEQQWSTRTPFPTPTPRPTPTPDSLLSKGSSLCEASFYAPISSKVPSSPFLTLINTGNRWKYENFDGYYTESRYEQDVNTIICIKEVPFQVGVYQSTMDLQLNPNPKLEGTPAYRIDWNVRLVHWSDGQVIAEEILYGDDPPSIIKGGESGYGRRPSVEFMEWMGVMLEDPSLLVHKATVYDLAFSVDGTLLVTGAADNIMRVWDVASGKVLHELQGHTRDIRGVAFSPDGLILSSASADGSIKLWDTNSWELLNTFTGHIGSVESIAFSPDGLNLATGSGEGAIKFWDLATGNVVSTIEAHKFSIWDIAFSPDGKTLASGGEDMLVKIWDVTTGNLIHEFSGHTNRVRKIAFSPNGMTLVSSGGEVIQWNVADGEKMQIFVEEPSVVGVAFSPDGALLAVGIYPDVRLWEINSGQLIRTLIGHKSGVINISFSPDGTLLATSSHDNTVRLWDLSIK